MPTQPGPPAGAQQIPEPPEPFTLHLKGQDDSWLGTVEVRWFADGRQALPMANTLPRMWCRGHRPRQRRPCCSWRAQRAAVTGPEDR